MSDAAPPALRLSGITKRFGSLVANDAVSLSLQAGEVLALLGENGAGKSTLVSILFGHYVADAGTVEVFGQRLPPGDPKAALAAGVGMVHQHFTLADNLSVLDNVMLGTEPLWSLRSRRGPARARLAQLAQRFGLQVDAAARVAGLSVGERQRVEILKALYRGARVLILDEPTSVLTPQESASLFATLAKMVAEGLAVIFISHKLDEVLAVSQRVAVLRAGRLVAQFATAGADRGQLAEAMVGRRVVTVRRAAPATVAQREVVCELAGASVAGSPRPKLEGIDLRLHAGEVLAIAGVAGNGQHTLADVLHGLCALTSGTLRIAGQALPAQVPRWVAAGVARIPEDRHAVGLVGDAMLWENAILERHAGAPFARAGVLRWRRAQAHAQALVTQLDVRGTEALGLATPARRLSGGNLQKFILGRALLSDATQASPPLPRLIVANQPTWGLDVGAVAEVHRRLLDACARGTALLLISEDLDEVFALADRIAVMHQGRLGAPRDAARWTLADIGLAMAGSAAPDGGRVHAA